MSASMPAASSFGRQLGDGALDVALAALAPRVEQLGQLAEALGLERLEGEVLELPLHLPDPEPLGQRRVDLHRLAGDALLLLDGRPYSVRMLWSRSASLIRTTRMSWAIASSILRMFSACCCSWLWVLNLDSLVTPSTSWATSGPNRSSTSVRLYSVSSGTSCRRAAWMAIVSSPSSARIWAEAIGCVTYGSPVARFWPRGRVDREVERPVDRLEVGVRVLAGIAASSAVAERLEVRLVAAPLPRAIAGGRRGPCRVVDGAWRGLSAAGAGVLPAAVFVRASRARHGLQGYAQP